MKSPGRWIVRAILLLSLLLFLGTAILWIRGTDWIGRVSGLRPEICAVYGQKPPEIHGNYSIGLYSSDDQIGIVEIDWGEQGLEPEELSSAVPNQPNGWVWNRTGLIDQWPGEIRDYVGTGDVRWALPYCLYSYESDGAGSQHFATVQATLVNIPVILAVSLIPWAIFFRAAVRRRCKFAAGHCRQCGYDLRATPDRCPECGTTARKVGRFQTAP
jgi:hypothetical protein